MTMKDHLFHEMVSQLTRLVKEPMYAAISGDIFAIGEGLLLILVEAGAPPGVLKDFLRWLTAAFEQCSCRSDFFKYAKFLCAWPLARYLCRGGNPGELPEGEFPRLDGCFGKWFSKRLVAYNKSNTRLLYSWLQAKRCCLPMDDSLVKAAFLEHKATLTRDDPVSFAEASLMMDLIRPELKEIRRAIRSSSPFESCSLPKTTACEQLPIRRGGQIGHVRVGPLGRFRYGTSKESLDLLQMTWMPICATTNGLKYNVTLTRLACTTWFQDPLFRQFGTFLAVSQRDYSEGESVELRVKCSDFFTFDETDGPKILKCTIEAVLEPLKCRTISKGDADFYYACKRLQEVIHGRMREMRVFRLIGQPISADMLLDIEQSGCEYYISGDYKSSTDFSSSRLGQMIGHEIWGEHVDFDPDTMCWVRDRVLPNWVSKVADAVFGLHRLSYPNKMAIEPVMQRNGQLMGSILSFPILCLINLIVYRQVANSENLNDHAVLINGDDIVFRGTKQAYDTYRRVAKRVGLVLSVGKTYVHRRYANMNSVCFDRTIGRNGRPHVTAVEYLNASLVLGKHKVQEKVSFREEELQALCGATGVRSFKEIQERGVAHWNRVSCSAKDKNQIFLWKVFKHYNSNDLLRSTSFHRGMQRPLFHPTVVGGLGLLSPFRSDSKLTKAEFACISHHVSSWERAGVGLSELPSRGPIVAVRTGLVDIEPDVHDESSIEKPRITIREECSHYFLRNWACLVNVGYAGCPPDLGHGASKGVVSVKVSKTVSDDQALNNSVPSPSSVDEVPSSPALRDACYASWDPGDLGYSYGGIRHEEVRLVSLESKQEDYAKALESLAPFGPLTMARRFRCESFTGENLFTSLYFGCRHVWVDFDLSVHSDLLKMMEFQQGKTWLSVCDYDRYHNSEHFSKLEYFRNCSRRVYRM